jgi:ribosomal protein L11 methyltransferase
VRYFEPYTEFRSRALKVPIRTPGGEEIFIEIVPGSSFGGEHQTTRLCIGGIQEIFKTRKMKTVLDLGCGSGILGICAAMLGAESVLAIDIDPLAVDEARKNVEINRVDSKVRVANNSIEDVRGKFELVVANIVRDELIRMAKEIKSVVKENGILLVSGIFENRKERAISRFKEIGFNLNREFVDSGWVAIWFNLESKNLKIGSLLFSQD